MNTKKSWVGAMAAIATLLVAGPAAAQDGTADTDSGSSFEAGIDYASEYVFRGVNLLGEDEGVLVPRAVSTFGNFSLWTYGYFGKFDTFTVEGDPFGDADYLEVDFGADYTFEFDSLSLTVGALTYQYGDDAQNILGFFDTYEVYAIAAWDVLLTPTISYYHDVDAVDGGYLNIGVSHSFPLGDRASLDLSGALGIDNQYNSDETFEPNDVLLGVDLPLTFNDNFSAHLMVQHSIALSALDGIGQGDETIVTAGVTAAF